MSFRSSDDAKSMRTMSKSWRPTRLGRLRRPLFLAFCAVCLVVWHHSKSGQSPVLSQHDSLDYSSFQDSEYGTPPEANVPPSVPNTEQRDAEEDRRREIRRQEDHLEADRLLEIQTIEKHLKEYHPVPGYKESEADDSQLETEEDQQLEIQNIQKHLEEEHAERRQSEIQHHADHSKNDTAPQGSENDQTLTVIEAVLDPETQKEPVITAPDQIQERVVLESESQAHLSLEEKADLLPDIVHIPFEEAVRNVTLDGWEDEWVANAAFDTKKWGKLDEPKIDFVYLWVNGSEKEFQDTKRPYELNSVLNDVEGTWMKSHGKNRYRDWDELRYSLRSIEKYAGNFRNKIQILVNSVNGTDDGKQIPWWLNAEQSTHEIVQVLAQEEFFDRDKHVCLPTFNSLTMENQIFNTPSNIDHLFALSDDMLLGKPHTASDIYSPLFGPVMGFKSNAYSTVNPPTEIDAHRFGEKPFLIYTSWLLNRRFGNRKRRGQGHFGHSLSRSVTREAISSFPGPELQSACKRFRGEPGFQLYSWYAAFHYTIERQREALLWSYIMLRSDADGDENLSWPERQVIMAELQAGMKNEGKSSFRRRNFYHVPSMLHKAGLAGPKVNTDIQWTSLDGPAAIREVECGEFDVNECLAHGFSTSKSDEMARNPIFSSAVIFDRVARQIPRCGDCLLKLLLNQVHRGLAPLLPHADTQPKLREMVVKAAMRYRYTIINPDALFVMVTDAEQVDSTLVRQYVRGKKQLAGQLCLNDDVRTDDEGELQDILNVLTELYQGLFPEKSPFEI